MFFRGVLLIACCCALSATAAPAPQNPVDAFAGDGASPAPSLGTFLQTLSTVTDLLNRFSRTFAGPSQYNEFDDVETAKPRVTLTEEKDATGSSVYKVTIVRPADSGPTFARQMESTTAAPAPPTVTTSAPSQSPPSQSPPTQSPPVVPTPTTTQSPAQIELGIRRRLQDLAWQLEQEENRREAEQDRQEMELERRQLDAELQGRQAVQDLELRQLEQERRLELDERRREIALEQAALDQERAILGQLKVAEPLVAADTQGNPAAAADQTAAGATITRVVHFESREDHSDERLLRALQRQNPNIQIVPRRSAPITTVDQRGRPIRIRYDSPELSLEDRIRYGANPKLIQVGRDGAQPVYRFADSDEVLYSTLYQPSQKTATAAQSSAPLVKQPLVVAPVAPEPGLVDTLIEMPWKRSTNYHHQGEGHIQPKYNTNHELFSEEQDESALSPIMFLLKTSGQQQQQQQQKQAQQYSPRETLEDSLEDSLEDISRSGNRLDEEDENDEGGELSDFQREWHYHPQPNLANDMRVNRIFRTRNADFHNPDAETFHAPSPSQRLVHHQPHPIK